MSILSKFQQPRSEVKQQLPFVALRLEVLTIDQFILKYGREGITDNGSVDELTDLFDEAIDVFVQPALIGSSKQSHSDKKVFLIENTPTYKPFFVQNFQDLVSRIITQEGFIESQGLHILARPKTIADVVTTAKKAK